MALKKSASLLGVRVRDDQTFAKLKQELDRVTDYYDAVRMYQFPIDGVLAVTILSKKKWKRVVVKPPQAQQERQSQASRAPVPASRNPAKARPGVPAAQQSQTKRP
jgi:hypothetical protein